MTSLAARYKNKLWYLLISESMTSGSSPALEMAASIWGEEEGEGLGGVVAGGIKSTYMSSERMAVVSPAL